MKKSIMVVFCVAGLLFLTACGGEQTKSSNVVTVRKSLFADPCLSEDVIAKELTSLKKNGVLINKRYCQVQTNLVYVVELAKCEAFESQPILYLGHHVLELMSDQVESVKSLGYDVSFPTASFDDPYECGELIKK